MYRLLVLLLCIITFNCPAQMKKGNRIIGASIGSIFFNSGTMEVTVPSPTTGYTVKNNSYGISLNPSMGWFITENLVVGTIINTTFKHEKTTNEASGNTYAEVENNSFNIGIGGFARNYFKSSPGKYVPFIQATLTAGSGTLKNEGFFYNGTAYKDTYSGKGSGIFNFNADLSIGLTKFLNENTGIDISAGYNFNYNKNTIKSTTFRDVDIDGDVDETLNSKPTQKTTNHGFTISAGYQVFLGKKEVK